MDVRRLQNLLRRDRGVDGDAQRIAQLTTLILLKTIAETRAVDDVLPTGFVVVVQDVWRSLIRSDAGATTLRNGLERLKAAAPDDCRWGALAHDFVALIEHDDILHDVVRVLEGATFGGGDRDTLGCLYESLISGLGRSRSAGEFYTPRPVVRSLIDAVRLEGGEAILDPACGSGGILIEALTRTSRKAGSTKVVGFELKRLPHLLGVANCLLHDGAAAEVLRGDGLELMLERPAPDVVVSNPPFGSAEIEVPHWLTGYRTRDTTALFVAAICERLSANGRAAIIVPEGFLYAGGGVRRVRERIAREGWIDKLVRLPGSVFAPYTSIPTNILVIDKSRHSQRISVFVQRLPAGVKAHSKTKPITSEHLSELHKWLRDPIDGADTYNLDQTHLAAQQYRLDMRPHGGAKTATLVDADLAALGKADLDLRESIHLYGQKLEQRCGDHLLVTSWMNALKWFRTDRESLWRIWQLAVRASLSGDLLLSPAPSGQSASTSATNPFGLREGWWWSTVGTLGRVVGGGTPPSDDEANFAENGTPWITPSDLRNVDARRVRGGRRSLTAKGFRESSAELLPHRSVLFTSRAPIGHVAINLDPLATNQGFKSVVCHDPAMTDFLFYYLRHATDIAYGISSGTTFKEISAARMRTMPVPQGPADQMRGLTDFWRSTYDAMDLIVTNAEAYKQLLVVQRERLLSRAA